MELALFWAVLAAALALGIPIAFALALGAFALLFLVSEGLPMTAVLVIMAQRMFAGSDSFAILALPLFFLAGSLMELGGISERIVRFAALLVGWVRGGLSMVAVVAEMFLSGITGSASADAAAIGSVMIPALRKRGYSPEFAAALVASGSAIGPIIPPSIGMVVYGWLADVSVARLFLGGMVPGILVGLALIGVCWTMAWRRGYPREPRPTAREAVSACSEAIVPLAAPGIILGGIFAGIFTATESAMVAVAYGMLVARYYYRALTWRQIFDICYRSAVDSSRVMFVIAVAAFVGWVLARERIPQQMAESLMALSDDPIVVLVIVNLLLLVFGCFLEGLAIMIVLLPTILPVIKAIGIDPVFFGVIVVINLAIGTVTPPVGVSLFVSAAIAGLPLERVIPELIPFLLALIGVLFLLVFFPGLVTWLPNTVL
jgi:C4-dicarboxylate transporter, DctM subunit